MMRYYLVVDKTFQDCVDEILKDVDWNVDMVWVIILFVRFEFEVSPCSWHHFFDFFRGVYLNAAPGLM